MCKAVQLSAMQNSQYYNANGTAQRAAQKSFAAHNTGVTAPLYRSCSANRLGAYGSQPFCHAAAAGTNGLRDEQQTVLFGPEDYQGHYGMAYKLRFPNYTGPVYQATIDTIGQGERNGPGDVGANQAVTVMGTKTSPYFRIVKQQ